MSRHVRLLSEYMHIVVRGNGRQILFEENADYNKYLFFLKRYSLQTQIKILAYCLMGNHVHLLVHDKNFCASTFMKKLGVSYAHYFNKKYEHVGHLFQDRYKNENIIDDEHLLAVFRYILNNPVKAGICKAEKYNWSSYKEYGLENCLTDVKVFLDMIGDRESLNSFMNQENNSEYMESDSVKKDDIWALKILQNTLKIKSGFQLQDYEIKKRNFSLFLLKKRGLSIRQIERLTGIGRGIIQKIRSDVS